MPDYLSLYGLEPAFEELTPAQQERLGELPWPDLSDDLQTWDTLHEMLLALAARDPSLRLRVLARGGNSWFGLFVHTARDGEVGHEEVELALAPDAAEPIALEGAPDVPLDLDADADAFVDDLAAAFEETSFLAADGQALTLDFRVDDREAFLAGLSAVAAHLEDGPAQMLVETSEGFERLTLDRSAGVRLEPLYGWCAEAELRAFVQRHVRAGSAPAAVPAGAAAPPATSKRDTASPLTTGSARAREEAIYDLDDGAAAANALRAALASPENLGPRFDALRGKLWEALEKRVGAAAVPELVRAVQSDRTSAPVVYALLSRFDDPGAHAALVHGFKTESGEARAVIRQVIWRQAGAVRRLVQDELVPSFGGDRAWSDTIIKLLQDEWIRVPRAWLGAEPPPELLARLGALVVEG